MTGVTLFSGGGLVECALSTRYGGPVTFIGAVELDPKIAAHYRIAHGDHCITASVCDVDFKRWRGAAYLHVSPPCTNASVANANAGETELDVELARAVIRAIRHIRPKVFTLENVPGYAGFYSAGIIGWALEEAGYTWDWAVYQAADYGTPQTRKRIILRAMKGVRYLPEVIQTHAEAGKAASQTGDLFGGKFLLPWVGWYAAIEDLLPQCPDSELANWQKKRLPTEIRESLLIGVNGQGDAGTASLPSYTTLADAHKVHRALLVGAQGYDGAVQHITGEHTAFPPNTTSGAGAYRALLIGGGSAGEATVPVASEQDPAFTTKSTPKETTRALLIEGQSKGNRPPTLTPADQPSPTQAGSGGGNLNRVLLPGYRCVSLTPRCLARFQGMPDSYPLPESKSLATKLIGNGVPIPLVKATVIPCLEMLS